MPQSGSARSGWISGCALSCCVSQQPKRASGWVRKARTAPLAEVRAALREVWSRTREQRTYLDRGRSSLARSKRSGQIGRMRRSRPAKGALPARTASHVLRGPLDAQNGAFEIAICAISARRGIAQSRKSVLRVAAKCAEMTSSRLFEISISGVSHLSKNAERHSAREALSAGWMAR